MAVVKFIPSRKPQSGGGLFGSMEYCKQEHKTWDTATQRHLVTGVNCVADTAFREFMNTKRLYEKTEGRMYYHVVQSFSPEEELTAETAHEIALKLAEQFSGFEVLVCTHTDCGHLHSHLIINSVSAEDGRKYHSDKDNIQRIRMASDELCMQYGLSVINPKQKRTPGMSAAEYRSADKGENWKLRLAITIDDAMEIAKSREHFIELMELEGYTDPEEQFRHENFLPVIITRELWEEVQFLIQQRKAQNVRAAPDQRIHRYSGLILCGDCGRSFLGKRIKLKAGDRVEYICSTYHRYGKEHCSAHAIREEFLDEVLKQELLNLSTLIFNII